MKAINIFIFLSFFGFCVSCGAVNSDDIEAPGESQKPDKEEVEQRDYDERFPFAVWTDEEGGKHFDVDLSDGSEAFPTADALMTNIVGRGWISHATYTYQWRKSAYSGKLITNIFLETSGFPISGGDTYRKIYFKDNTTATVFYKWVDYPDFSNIFASSQNKTYTYSARTGALDVDALKRYKVIFSDNDNLWLIDKREKELEGDCTVLHLKSVSDATVAEWQNTYTDPHKDN